ncbi:MAG: hypothetical protein CMJ40_00475 [Phycisphaerae bacterium]|nr:hypothetical protein [Phycisphaerae bacterium]
MCVSDTDVNTSRSWPSRILHLVDGSVGDHVSPRLDHVEDLVVDRPHDVILTVGGPPTGTHGALPLQSRLPELGSGVLGSLLKRRQLGSAGFDVVHAWGIHSAMLSAGLQRKQSLAITVDGFDASDSQARRAAAVMLSGRGACSFGSTRSMEQAVGLAGGHRFGSGGEEIICPVMNPGRFHDRDEDMRRSWGAGSDTMVMGVIGSPMEQLNLFDFGSMAPRCSMFHQHVVLVVSSRASRRGDLVRWLASAGLDVELVFDDRIDAIHTIASSLDMAVAPSSVACRSRICDVAPILAAAAAGVPVVLGVNHPAAEYADRNALIHPSVMHGEHQATKWLIERLDEACPADREAWRKQWARHLAELGALYERAMSLSGASRVTAAS